MVGAVRNPIFGAGTINFRKSDINNKLAAVQMWMIRNINLKLIEVNLFIPAGYGVNRTVSREKTAS